MPAPLRIHLSPEEDAQLRELETNPVVPHKVRRRAQVVRLAAQGWTAPRIARHLGLDRATARRDLRRWLRQGLDGLVDGKAPGAKPRWTEGMTAYLQELLSGERAWTVPLLAEALERRFFTRFHPGTVRRRLLALGYRWKRTRYVPVGKPGRRKHGHEIALEAQTIASAALKMAGGLFPPAFFVIAPSLAALGAFLLYELLAPHAPVPALLSTLTAITVGAWLLPGGLGRQGRLSPAASAVALASSLPWAFGSYFYWQGLHGGSLLEVAFGGTAAILGYAYLFPHLEAGLAQMGEGAEPPQ